jgi:uncharacterized RDD family membrane protein YckC
LSAYHPPPPPPPPGHGYGYGYPQQWPGPSYAGTGRRIGGYLLDFLFLTIISMIASCFIGLVTGAATGFSDPDESAAAAADGLGSAVGLVLFFGYYVGTTSRWSRSPGQACVGIRLASARDGGEPSVGQLFGRYGILFLMLLPCAIPAIVNAFLIGGDPQRQGWHDKAAGTLVLRD